MTVAALWRRDIPCEAVERLTEIMEGDKAHEISRASIEPFIVQKRQVTLLMSPLPPKELVALTDELTLLLDRLEKLALAYEHVDELRIICQDVVVRHPGKA